MSIADKIAWLRKESPEEIKIRMDNIGKELEKLSQLIKTLESPGFKVFDEMTAGIYSELLEIAKEGSESKLPLEKKIDQDHALKAMIVIDEINRRIVAAKQRFNKLSQEYRVLNSRQTA